MCFSLCVTVNKPSSQDTEEVNKKGGWKLLIKNPNTDIITACSSVCMTLMKESRNSLRKEVSLYIERIMLVKKWILAMGLIICLIIVGAIVKINNEIRLPYVYIDGTPYIDVTEPSLSYHAVYDEIDRQLHLAVRDNLYIFTEGITVAQINEKFVPLKKNDFLTKNRNSYVTAEFLLKNEPKLFTKKPAYLLAKKQEAKEEIIEVAAAKQFTVEEVSQYFQTLRSPLKGAKADIFPSHIPGAPRTYRYGFHEGLDWYTYSAGTDVNRRTPVYAMGEGTVVRVDHEYKPYESERERKKDLAYCKTVQRTPQYILDKLRGRQVWVQFDNGMQARFAHLDLVSERLKVGSRVTEDTQVGYVGNSGTSGEVKKDDTELHLHVDLLIKGVLFWKGLSKEEIQHVVANELSQSL
ncbi:M23 family metallopeptidase [Priestia megaterium]|nr:M23 family metallopeptidase [Priestia megaterium]